MTAFDGLIALGRWSQEHPQFVWGAMAGGILLGAGLRVLSGGHRKPRDMHGSARWATYREVKHSGFSRTEGVVVGVLRGTTFYDNGPKHIFLCGPTRSNKGVCHIQPTLQHGWYHTDSAGDRRPLNALICDPKRGENYDLTHEARQSLGRVEAFAPYRQPLARLNVLDTIRLRTLHEHGDALTIAQSLTAPYKMVQENSTSLHFRELAAMLLTAAILHVCYTMRHSSLAACWYLLTQQHRTLADCLKTLRGTRHTPHGAHPTIAQFTQAIRNISGDRELSSVWTTVIRPLALYADPLIAASTDTSTLRLEDLQHGSEPLSLYLLAPSPRALERLHPIYRVIVDVALARLMDRPVTTSARRLLVCAEEMPAYGYMPSLNTGASDMAGYGIKGLFVAQDLDQFEDTYGTKNTIWGNTETKIFHAPDNERTAERISRYLLGAATVDNPVASRQGMLRDGSVSYQHVERPLLTTDEVQSLAPAQMIVRRTGSKPMLLEKLGYDPRKHKEAAA
jgi:type IV secretion system protein VirD4